MNIALAVVGGYPKTGVPLAQVLFVTDFWIVPLTQAWLLPFGRIDHLLLDLRVHDRDQVVDELMVIYERSQDLWAQQWRDELSELRTLNRTIQRMYERPRYVS
ncbi:MAG: hypothetical protein ACJ0GY_10790 [Synechococcus sp.]|nr:hypothetical protein [Synechococcus sp.]